MIFSHFRLCSVEVSKELNGSSFVVYFSEMCLIYFLNAYLRAHALHFGYFYSKSYSNVFQNINEKRMRRTGLHVLPIVQQSNVKKTVCL